MEGALNDTARQWNYSQGIGIAWRSTYCPQYLKAHSASSSTSPQRSRVREVDIAVAGARPQSKIIMTGDLY